MSRFITTLSMARGPNKDWVLLAPLFYESELCKRIFRVPTGFETDLDSVPRLPFMYVLFKGVCDEAAVLHDYLYSTGAVPRKLADEVFREAMEAMGVPAWRRWAIWAGVRAGGGSHYKQEGTQ